MAMKMMIVTILSSPGFLFAVSLLFFILPFFHHPHPTSGISGTPGRSSSYDLRRCVWIEWRLRILCYPFRSESREPLSPGNRARIGLESPSHLFMPNEFLLSSYSFGTFGSFFFSFLFSLLLLDSFLFDLPRISFVIFYSLLSKIEFCLSNGRILESLQITV